MFAAATSEEPGSAAVVSTLAEAEAEGPLDRDPQPNARTETSEAVRAYAPG